jgi:hypothetical protein
MKPLSYLMLAAVAFGMTACSTVSSRIRENPQAFYGLHPDDRTRVERGMIREGMPKEAVYIAWGNPDSVRKGAYKGRSHETWIYYGTSSYPVDRYSYYPHRHGRYHYYAPIYDPIYVPYRYYLKSATFVDGRVVAWDAPR